jgi:uncharacterized protein
LHIFREEGLRFGLRCSVDREIASSLADTMEYFCASFRPAVVNLEPIIPHAGCCSQAGIEPPAPEALVEALVAAAAAARKHGVTLRLGTGALERVARSSCGVSEDNFVVAPDGTVSGCYMVNHRSSPHCRAFAFGAIDAASGRLEIDAGKLRRLRACTVEQFPRCRNCFAKWHCSGGCRVFQSPPGARERPDEMCAVTRALTKWRILAEMRLFDEADRVRLEPEPEPRAA